MDMPMRYMVGQSSTASSFGVTRLLTGVLPRVEVMAFDGLGYMGT